MLDFRRIKHSVFTYCVSLVGVVLPRIWTLTAGAGPASGIFTFAPVLHCPEVISSFLYPPVCQSPSFCLSTNCIDSGLIFGIALKDTASVKYEETKVGATAPEG